MSIDPTAVGATTAPRIRSWKDRDTLLYALGIGADQNSLAFVTENSHDLPQRVFPSWAVVACDANVAVTKAGRIDFSRLVHGSQGIRLFRPLSAAGELEVTASISGIQDKGEGKNAVITMTARGTDPVGGALVVETTSTLVIRGAGGFGGEPGVNPSRVEYPDRAPDIEIEYFTRADQALIYRLSGDRNPLHSDPWFAVERAGFDRPILHGLCTYGFTGRALLHALSGNDPARFIAMSSRFTSPAYPEDKLIVSIWRTQPGQAVFLTRARGPKDSEDRVVIDDGRAEFVEA
jgi:acyl dehydratase